MSYNRSFKGEINGVKANDFRDALDYSIKTQEERIEYVDALLYGMEDGLHSFFVEYFDSSRKPKPYFNYSPKSGHSAINDPDGSLSLDNNVCKVLEAMADYILFSPDIDRRDKSVRYNIIKENSSKWRSTKNKETSYNDMHSKLNSNLDTDTDTEDVIDFFMEEVNYKKEIKQEIYKSDIADDELYPLRDYEKFNTILKKRRKVLLDKSKAHTITKDEKSELKVIIDTSKQNKSDQIYLKDMLKGTIYFKNVLPSHCEYDWDLFDFFDEKHVLALLKVKRRPVIDDLGILIYDMDKMIKKANLDSIESNLLREYRYRDKTFTKIAKETGFTRSYVASVINRIAKKVMKVYEDQYEDWYYLNVVKGKYKKCSKCEKIKFANERHFSYDVTNSRWKSWCKECINS